MSILWKSLLNIFRQKYFQTILRLFKNLFMHYVKYQENPFWFQKERFKLNYFLDLNIIIVDEKKYHNFTFCFILFCHIIYLR